MGGVSGGGARGWGALSSRDDGLFDNTRLASGSADPDDLSGNDVSIPKEDVFPEFT